MDGSAELRAVLLHFMHRTEVVTDVAERIDSDGGKSNVRVR